MGGSKRTRRTSACNSTRRTALAARPCLAERKGTSHSSADHARAWATKNGHPHGSPGSCIDPHEAQLPFVVDTAQKRGGLAYVDVSVRVRVCVCVVQTDIIHITDAEQEANTHESKQRGAHTRNGIR